MNRLQKKCLIAVAGTHLLLVVLLLCSGFIKSQPKPVDVPSVDVIPSTLIDAAFNSGMKSAQLPPPTPIIKPPEPQVQPEPQPKPEVKPFEPVKQPEPQPIKPPEKIQPEDPTPEKTEPAPKPPKKHEPKISLTPVVHQIKPVKPDTSEADAREAAKEAKRIRDQKIKAFQSVTRAIKDNASSATVVDTNPGSGSVSYANYASVVKSIYEHAWTPPDDTSSDDANVKVSVTISCDGRVLDAHIIDDSGDAHVDNSIRRTLDRVTFIAPFPEGAKEKERTFKINFNLKARRMLG